MICWRRWQRLPPWCATVNFLLCAGYELKAVLFGEISCLMLMLPFRGPAIPPTSVSACSYTD